jgi:hypothetical protein
MAASGEGTSPRVSAEERRVATAKLVALFTADGFSEEHIEALQRLLLDGAADLDVRIGGMTPLLLVRAASGVASRQALCLALHENLNPTAARARRRRTSSAASSMKISSAK